MSGMIGTLSELFGLFSVNSCPLGCQPRFGMLQLERKESFDECPVPAVHTKSFCILTDVSGTSMWGRAVGAVTRAEAGIATSLAIRTCALSLLTRARWDGGGVKLEYLYRVNFVPRVPSCQRRWRVKTRQRGAHPRPDRHKQGNSTSWERV